MVVQHNLTAMNSNRMLGLTTSSQAKSTEKLSSGYKINRAADDAAGLSISEKMRKQIRGLTQASSNAQDGISAVQTAEGALNEVQDMLQRMNELAVKAANGTMSENDRTYIQNEVDQLTEEIDRVAETTKFNETYLLKGDKTAKQEYQFSYNAATSQATIAANTTLYKADGSKIVDAADLADYLDTDPTAKVYSTKPETGAVATTTGAEPDYTYKAAVASDGYVNVDGGIYAVNTGSGKLIAKDQSVADYLTANAGGDVPNLKANTLYVASTATITASSGLMSGPDSTIYVYNNTSTTIGGIAPGQVTTFSSGTSIANISSSSGGSVVLTNGLVSVVAADTGDLTGLVNGSDAEATIKAGITLYTDEGDSITSEQDILDYYADSGNASKSLYTTKPQPGTDTTEGVEYTYTPALKLYDKDGNAIASNALNNYFETTDGTTITQKAGTKLYDEDGELLDLTAADIAEYLDTPTTSVGALKLSLHVGADATANNQISIDISAMSAGGLGVKDLEVDGTDDTNALNAIDTIKEAIQKVSTQRSALGAVQNRLEHTINNLDNVVENTTSAESSIRDTDMATEMVKYSNNNILAQAGQAMLAQSNQANQGVLSLLQ